MSHPADTWNSVDQYLTDLLVRPEPSLHSALVASHDAGLPAINVSPPQGKLLQLLIKWKNARRILEIGTLGAYSTIWLARALPPDGRLVTLESEPTHAAVARSNLSRAGLNHLVDLHVGPAVETLERLAALRTPPFDFIFIDADKPSYPDYLQWSLKLSRPGTLIIADNTIRDGAVIDAHNVDPRVQGVRKLHELIAAEPRLSATALQTVGSKGYDGFTIALVIE
jgi:predicted O-methyltransferase YrrM